MNRAKKLWEITSSALTSRAKYRLSAFCGVALAFLGLTSSVHASLIINPAYDSSITNDANAVMIEAGINAAITRLESVIANPITVAITFQEGGGLGGSSTFVGSIPYATYRSALQTNQTLSANDNTAIAALPATTNNPVNGSSSGIQSTLPLFRALGFAANPPTGSPDSTITLNTSIMNLSRTGTQNSNFYDLQAVAEHEMDEVLGIGGPGSTMQLAGAYTGQASPTSTVGPLDLFRYSANGVRSFTMNPANTAYFSINGGATSIVNFNQNGANGADFADWGNGGTGTGDHSGNTLAQLQDAYGGPGVDVNLGTSELTALDVIGYNVIPLPEPASAGVLTIVLGGLLVRRRRV